MQIYKIDKDTYFDIVVTWPTNQMSLYAKINPEKDLLKMRWLNLIEAMVKDYCWVNEIAVRSEDYTTVSITDYSEVMKEYFKSHIRCLCVLFNISEEVVPDIEKHTLKQRELFIALWELIFTYD